MSKQTPAFSTDEAREIGERIGIDWNRSRFDVVSAFTPAP